MPPFLRRLIPYLTVVLGIVILYDAATFYVRWRNKKNDEEQQAARVADEAKKTIEMLGGDQLKILSFYAMPGAIREGESASLCYGVNAATKVSISPDVGTMVYPAYSRCLQVKPKASTEFTLTAEDSSGKKVTGTVKVGVIK